MLQKIAPQRGAEELIEGYIAFEVNKCTVKFLERALLVYEQFAFKLWAAYLVENCTHLSCPPYLQPLQSQITDTFHCISNSLSEQIQPAHIIKGDM